MCHGQLATENMPIKRSLDLSEGFCTEKALKKRPPPLDLVLLGAEAARCSCLKTLDLLGQNLILLPFLSLKDLKKFGCVNKSVQAFVGKYLTTRGKCLLCEEKMLREISDILGDVTNRMISIYMDDPFKAGGVVLRAFRVFPSKHNKIMGKEEGITAVGGFQDERGRYVELNLMPQLPHSVKAGIYEVYAFDDMIIGEADGSSSRPIATGTYNNLARLFKTFRQHVDPMEDAEDAKEYNVLHKSIAKRERERQNEEEEDYLYGPLDHRLVADDNAEEQSGAPPLVQRRRREGVC